MAVLGLGSIGASALRLLLTVLGTPSSLALCDLAEHKPRLTALAADLQAQHGALGPVQVLGAGSAPPPELYSAQLIVGATSTPGVLDVTRLTPGTVLVDDSFPPCCDPAQAVARMRTAGDLLIVGGGLLRCGTVTHTSRLPLPKPVRNQLLTQLPEGTLPSCQLEALLCAKLPGRVTPTLGPVRPAAARAVWEALPEAGLEAAPLHLGSYRPGPAELKHLRRAVELGDPDPPPGA